jgi:hypothetical protein
MQWPGVEPGTEPASMAIRLHGSFVLATTTLLHYFLQMTIAKNLQSDVFFYLYFIKFKMTIMIVSAMQRPGVELRTEPKLFLNICTAKLHVHSYTHYCACVFSLGYDLYL